MALHTESGVLSITLKGDFIEFDGNDYLYENIKTDKFHKVEIIGKDINRWDSSLLLILFEIKKFFDTKGIEVKFKNMPQGVDKMIDLAFIVPEHIDSDNITKNESVLDKIGGFGLNIWEKINKGLDFIAESFLALWCFIRGKSSARKTDFMFIFEDCGPNAMSIVALISFMVGLILAFVGAIQLKTFGAQVFVADLVTIGMIRIMGAIMVGIIMSGRTGASFAASIGTMQVNEEIDALKTMGISWADFLVAPRMAALIIAMPFLTMWADFFGILGGAFVGIMALDIPFIEYFNHTFNAWTMKNFWVGIFHGFVFGFIISICGCYYGINSSKNADGVGEATTKAVVSSIVWLIITTGIITFIFERLGI